MYLNENAEKGAAHTRKLTEYLCKNLCGIRGIKLYSVPNVFGIVTFSMQNMQSEVAAYNLSEEYSICVRGGLHCAPLMHKALLSDGLIRASVCAFNSMNECEKFIVAVENLSSKDRK